MGYRTFRFNGGEQISLKLQGSFQGAVTVSTELDGEAVAEISVCASEKDAIFPSTFLSGKPLDLFYLPGNRKRNTG